MTPAAPRHVVVTGAGTGIGRAVALKLAKKGVHLSLLARDTKRLKESAALCEARGARTAVRSLDITDARAVERTFAALRRAHGPLRALVANSGVGGPNGPPGPDGEKDRFDLLLDVNLRGTYHCLRAAEAHMAAGPAPRQLVVISSILGRIGVPGYTGYCASKAGLLGLVRALAMELAPAGIRVNALCPGWVDTEMAREGLAGMAAGLGISLEAAHSTAMADVPLARMSTPAEIAGWVAWLLSKDAEGVTGQAFDVNGGAFMH